MVDRVDTEDAGTLYLDVVDILARRGEQLQARSSLSESLGALGLEHVILFLSGGLAAGILERLGERALDQTLSKLAAVYRKFRSNGPREEASADKAAAAVAYITTVIRIENISAEWMQEQLEPVLRDIGYSHQAAELLAHQIATRLHQ